MNIPIIEVRYYGDEPKVTLPPEVLAVVRLVNGDEEDLLVLEHAGVQVYSCVKDFEIVSDYWMSIFAPCHIDSDSAFDIRDLAAPPLDKEEHYEALFPGQEDQQKLAYAIDQGWLTEDGLCLPSED
jgi:hypothetical protein